MAALLLLASAADDAPPEARDAPPPPALLMYLAEFDEDPIAVDAALPPDGATANISRARLTGAIP